jgi:3-methyladenine DNA glycosylase/8-oxoguanine DNA glycosylase
MKIKTEQFDFEKLIRSHGWVFLSPFEWCEDTKILNRPFSLSKNKKIKVKIQSRDTANNAHINISWKNNHSLSYIHKTEIKNKIIRMIRLDEDFSEFHKICKGDPILSFVFKNKCGGMLRGATAFEDLVKTVCTTNCDWRNTKRMCDGLCKLAGGNFPVAETILKYSPKELSRKIPLGYRARTILEISDKTANGELNIDEWARNKNYEQIRASLKKIWGIGEYSINHLLVLLGDYSRIPVDSEVLAYLRKTHFMGEEVPNRKAVMPYDKYGKYKFLAFKFGRMARKLNYVNK